MAKNRMAGEKLDEPTQESADAKEALSQSEQRKRARERIGNDPERLAERLSGIDREKYDFDGYTDKEINMAMKGGIFDENDYARLTGNPIEKPEDETPKPDDDDVSIPTPTPTPTPAPTPAPTPVPEKPGYKPPIFVSPGMGGGTQVVNQDNDINTNVTGDGNTVTDTQDNSVRQGGYSPASRSQYLRDRYVADVSRFVRA
jgi:hypothetical protein